MTLLERMQKADQRHLPDNTVPMDRKPERRTTARWLDWTRANEKRGADLTGYVKEAA